MVQTMRAAKGKVYWLDLDQDGTFAYSYLILKVFMF
jgi:hypothetical protein